MPSIPLPSTPPPSAPRRAPRAPRLPAGFAATMWPLFGSGYPQRLLDLREDPRFAFAEFLRDLLPAAEHVDREQARRLREPVRARDARDHGSVALLHPDGLPFGGGQVADEVVGRRGRCAFAD